MIRRAVGLLTVSLALLAGATALGWQAWTLRSSWQAQAIYGQARLKLSDDPVTAFSFMQEAHVRFPWNPEYRRDLLVPIAKLAEKGQIVNMTVAAQAYADSIAVLGWDQNVLVSWLDYLGRAGLVATPGYASALERLEQTNPVLSSYWQFVAWQADARNDRQGLRFAAESMLHFSKEAGLTASAEDILARLGS